MCQRWSTGQPGWSVVILRCAENNVVVSKVADIFHSLYYDTQQDVSLKKIILDPGNGSSQG